MARSTEGEIRVASAEAFRGALVGAAKVEPPSIPPMFIHIARSSPRLVLLTP